MVLQRPLRIDCKKLKQKIEVKKLTWVLLTFFLRIVKILCSLHNNLLENYFQPDENLIF